MARKRTRKSKRIDVRIIYSMSGSTGDYARFLRDKVVPIIGEAALRPIPSKKGSRVREYSVTKNNLVRVVKAMGLDPERYKGVQAVRKAIVKAGPDAAAEMIMKLVESTEQPKPDDVYPISFRIPIHPISENRLYTKSSGRVHKTAFYVNWKSKFVPLINAIVPDTDLGVDFSKPLSLHMTIGHREKSDAGYEFDLQNLDKAPIDCAFEHFGSADSKVRDLKVEGVFVDSYEEGFIEYKIRNL